LSAGKKLWLLFEDSLQKRNGVTEIPQLDRCDRFQPMRALIITEFFLGFNRHIA
jgi:hypothetical protein